jgi:hypothetical protein
MKDSVILEGKIYISAKRAAKIINYAQDYIGQLCRSGKLDCKMIGRSWFVTEESLLAHRADAIDATQERVLKVIKNNDVATKETIKAVTERKVEVAPAPAAPAAPAETKIISPVAAPVVSPIQSTSFKYEVEKTSLLPELKKKVPVAFELPKKVAEYAPAPTITIKRISTPRPVVRASAPAAVLTVDSTHNFATTAIIVLVALGGFFFTLSLASLNNKSLSYGNDASVSSAAQELVGEILKSLGLRGRSPTVAVDRGPAEVKTVAAPTETAGELNGIGIFPASTPEADELAKQKIMNAFSDEVLISPDQSGRAGVITPVFKKTNGTDFVYVMVPVQEQKQ